MRRLIFIIGTALLILSGCNSKDSVGSKVAISIEESRIENQNKREVNEKIDVDEEMLDWMEIEQWDSITVSNSCVGESTEVTDKEFLNDFRLDRMLEYVDAYEVVGHLNYGKGQPYEYKFVKGDKEYIIKAVTENVALIQGEYYECNNIQALGNAFAPATEFQKVERTLSKIYYSDLYFWGGYIFSEKSGNLVVQYIVREQEESKLKEIRELPEIKSEKNIKIEFYWHGEVITMNVLTEGQKEYLVIEDGNKVIIYEQNHVEYSVLNNFGI